MAAGVPIRDRIVEYYRSAFFRDQTMLVILLMLVLACLHDISGTTVLVLAR